jgi:hypothetical protein
LLADQLTDDQHLLVDRPYGDQKHASTSDQGVMLARFRFK